MRALSFVHLFTAFLILLPSTRLVNAQDTIFFDDFNGQAGLNLSGLLPDTTFGPNWIASSIFDADGSIDVSSPGSATLAFTPSHGNIYTLDTSFRDMTIGSGAGSPENDWFALGFGAGQSTGSTTNDRFIVGNLIGKSWSLVRGHTGSNATNTALLGTATQGTGGGTDWTGLTNAFGGDMDLRIVLDTTAGSGGWTSTWYARRPTDSAYTQVRSTETLVDETINSVGIAKSGPGITGRVSSFSLTGPIPTPTPLPDPPTPTNPYTSFSAVDIGQGSVAINATSFSRDNLVTHGDQQYIAYYVPVAEGGTVTIAQRTLGSDDWTISNTTFTPSDIQDPHDVISMGIDRDGIMHVSWGQHASRLNYARSTAPVTQPGSAIQFNNLGTAGMTNNESRVTYPEFVNLPDGDLLYFFRTNGGSGNADLSLNRYDSDTDTWSRVVSPIIDGNTSGDPSSSNPYWHTPILDDNGRLHLTWSYRWNTNSVNNFRGFQTNHDIYYAYSDDEGVTWRASDGMPYTSAITQSTSDLVVQIDQGSSLINQASMALDQNNLPVIATWWAPEASSGNQTRQYMLAWADESGWQTTQITDFIDDYDNGNTPIPENQLRNNRMSRPTVLVDEDDRVLVLFTDVRMGNTLMMAHSMDRATWDFVELDDTVLGHWEPSYDPVRWENDGVISMLYQPSGLGNAEELVSVFEFDARSYFDDLLGPLLGDLNGDGTLTDADIEPFVQALTDPAAYADAYPNLDPDLLGDFNNDGQLTNGDIAGFIDAINNAGLTANNIPEPTSLAILGLAGLLATRRR